MQQCDDDSRLSALHSDGADGRGLRHRRSGVRAVRDAAFADHRWARGGSLVVLHGPFRRRFVLHPDHGRLSAHLGVSSAVFKTRQDLCRGGIFRS